MRLSKEDFNKIKDELYDDGMKYCEVCDNYFLVRGTSDVNTRVCPICGVVSDDNIHVVEIEKDGE